MSAAGLSAALGALNELAIDDPILALEGAQRVLNPPRRLWRERMGIEPTDPVASHATEKAPDWAYPPPCLPVPLSIYLSSIYIYMVKFLQDSTALSAGSG